MDEKSSSGLPVVAIQLRVEWQLAPGELMQLASAQFWNEVAPERDRTWSYAERSSSYGGSGIDRIEEGQNVFLEHARDYSMLIAHVEYANEQAAYANPMQTMGDRIRQLRQARDLSQSQLADRVGVTAGAISQWENGLTKNIKLETFLRLCEELGTVPHYLIFGPGKQPTTGRRQA